MKLKSQILLLRLLRHAFYRIDYWIGELEWRTTPRQTKGNPHPPGTINYYLYQNALRLNPRLKAHNTNPWLKLFVEDAPK